MICMLVNFSQEGLIYENEYWIPKEVWVIIKEYMLYHRFFSTRYQFFAHKCIMLARFPTLMDFIKEQKYAGMLHQRFVRLFLFGWLVSFVFHFSSSVFIFLSFCRIDLNLPQNFNPNAMRSVLTWVYCGQLNAQPQLLADMLPIAKKLKLYNLLAICEGRGHQPPVQKRVL
jgi:hypothetical protein